MNTEEKRTRIKWIDTLKGVLIILVVIGHICNSSYESGIYVNGVIRGIKNFIYSFHMMTFFTLSGYVFSISCLEVNSRTVDIRKEKVKKQVLNKLTIYLLYEIIRWLIKIAADSLVNNPVGIFDLLMIPFKSIDELWYIYVLAILDLSTGILLICIKKLSKYVVVICFLLIVGLDIVALRNILFELIPMKVIYYFCAFYYGIFLHEIMGKRRFFKLNILLLVVGCVGVFYRIFISAQNDILNFFTAILISFSLVFFFSELDICINIFQYLGKRSLEIYLLHVYITSGLRLIIELLEINEWWISFSALTILGIAIPISVSELARKMGFWDVLFCPYNYIKGRAKA